MSVLVESIVLVNQMAALALALADQALVLEDGHIVAQGSAASLVQDASLTRAYLGV